MNILYPDMTFIPCNSDYRKASKNADIVVTAVFVIGHGIMC